MLFIFILICAEDVKMMMFLLFLLYSGSSLKKSFSLKAAVTERQNCCKTVDLGSDIDQFNCIYQKGQSC